MHVTFVSASEFGAIKRTGAVLDSYAIRSGSHNWQTPITAETLEEVHATLRHTATRNTAVACYRHGDSNQMQLMWIVGHNSAFGPKGPYPITATPVKPKRVYPEWLKVVSAVARMSGLTHDLGKFNIYFVNKLKSLVPISDAIRHEWISMKLVPALLLGKAWSAAWKNFGSMLSVGVFEKPLANAIDVVTYNVATHHRLPSENSGTIIQSRTITASNHVRDAKVIPVPVGAPNPKILRAISKGLNNLSKLNESPLYWRSVALLSRVALVFADHFVSSQNHSGQKGHVGSVAYANTTKDARGNPLMNQDLSWHLLNVGEHASWFAEQMAFFNPPGLSAEGIASLDQVAKGPFEWQEEAASRLKELSKTDGPSLVFNVAGTGSGKTRMNARAIIAMAGSRTVRFATALNLRTLTLQTGDAYREQLGINSYEVATVIGDEVTKVLHGANKSSNVSGHSGEDTDGNLAEPDVQVFGTSDPLPDWLGHFLHKVPHLRAIIGAPALVSTADYLVNAGEPHKQGHHALAMLRLMTSDLIIDEADGYDPHPLAAMLRLINLSAFFGRKVVVSSATLSYPVAEAIYRVFEHGVAMRSALTKTSVVGTYAIINDKVAPKIGVSEGIKSFMAEYRETIAKITTTIAKEGVIRWPTLVNIPVKTLEGWHHAIAQATLKLHGDNNFIDPISGKRISVGLARIANIKGVIPVARYLAQTLAQARIVCYHSQLYTAHRYNIEKRLDFLLNRKGANPNDNLLNDPEIRKIIDNHDGPDLMIIVVASPVEEIGRDHDFDYAVVEPSSASSLVQVGGRVQRHRKYIATAPNVGILRFNRNAILGRAVCFSRPGLETLEFGYGTADMALLLDWDDISSLDAAIRFGNHKLSQLDDRNARRMLKDPLERILGEDSKGNLWMSENTYADFTLRAESGVAENWVATPDSGEFKRIEQNDYHQYVPISKEVVAIPRVSNDLFVLSANEIKELADSVGLGYDDAFSFKVRATNANATGDKGKLYVDESFGMCYP